MAIVRTKKNENNSPKSPSEEQAAAINCRSGYTCLVAGPGSGKSFVLVQRYAALIEEGVDPDEILSLSFTKTSAANLRDRVEALVGQVKTTRTAGAVTFHSLALQFAQKERDEYPFELSEFPLSSEPVSNKMASESGRRLDVDTRALRSAASLWRRSRVGPAEAIRDCEARLDPKQLKLALAYKDYDKRCKEAGLLDFDALIFHAVQIMDKKPEVRSRWKRNWLQLDESQDMSKIEWDLVRLVAGTSVLAVGDVSQGIYGFRGSDPKLFSSMNTIFPGTQTLYLSANYRSTPEIIDFIRPISSSKELAERFHTKNDSGPKPVIKGFLNSADESKWAVDQIKGELWPNSLVS